MQRKTLALLSLTATALAFADARAAFPTAQFQATANVNANCTVTESGTLDFGNYDPLSANATAAQPGSGASLSIKCTRGSHPLISMDNGAALGGGAIAGKRAMLTGGGGANKGLSYDVLQPTAVGAAATASANPWGATAATKFDAGVVTVSPTTAQVVLIFGSIPAAQDVVTGVYTDTVTATVEF